MEITVGQKLRIKYKEPGLFTPNAEIVDVIVREIKRDAMLLTTFFTLDRADRGFYLTTMTSGNLREAIHAANPKDFEQSVNSWNI